MDRLLSAAALDSKAYVVVVEMLLANLHARVDGSRDGLVDDHLDVSILFSHWYPADTRQHKASDAYVLQHSSILTCPSSATDV